MRYSPLEQFERIGRRFLTNISRIRRGTGRRRVGIHRVVRENGNGSIVPNRWQRRREGLCNRVGSIRIQTVGIDGQRRYPFVYTRFTYVLARNRLGLIPYSYTVTSHLVVTITLARGVWIGKRRIGFRIHGRKRFGRLLPAGTPFRIIPIIVPLELLGFTITFVSLSVRLFANIIAGHILLKVIGGFAWTMISAGGLLYRGHFVPRIVLLMLYVLETGVAFIQAYVFALLTCIYLTDVIQGSH